MNNSRLLKYCTLFIIVLLFSKCSTADDMPTPTPDPGSKEVNKNKSGVILFKETYSSFFERDRLNRFRDISDFTSTGLFLKSGMSIEVSADLLKGTHLPTLLLGAFSRDFWSQEPLEFPLSSSPQIITNESPKDELIYIRYSSDSPNSESNITFTGGLKTPYFIYDTTTQADFLAMLENYTYSDVVLSSNRAHIAISKRTALRYKDQHWNELLKTIHKILDQEAYIDGLDGSSPIHTPSRNTYLFVETEDPNYWMAAYDRRTFYNTTDAIDFLIDVESLKNEGWGPWHELGHQYQQSSLTWSKTIEVTTNIYSLAVARMFGLPSRLKEDNIWANIDTYFDTPIEDRDFNDDSQLGAFERLALYQQLWLKYGDEFFIKMHKKAREEAKKLYDDEEKMSYFILKASEVSGNNLNEFFKSWGFILPEQSFSVVDDLLLETPSEDLTLLRE